MCSWKFYDELHNIAERTVSRLYSKYSDKKKYDIIHYRLPELQLHAPLIQRPLPLQSYGSHRYLLRIHTDRLKSKIRFQFETVISKYSC